LTTLGVTSATLDSGRIAAFIRSETRLIAPPLVPEIRLHLTDAMTPLWEATEVTLQLNGVPPPYWAFAWVGGQALARYVLDHGRAALAGKRVLDLAAGSGIGAIAAALVGADACAADIDRFACIAADINAEANGVRIATSTDDILASTDASAFAWDAVLAGDVCYEKPMAERMMALLHAVAATGRTVWLADPGRNYLPRGGLDEIARYTVPCSRELEDTEEKTVRIFRVLPTAA
jgi:predicted nicotinamide N-methyase